MMLPQLVRIMPAGLISDSREYSPAYIPPQVVHEFMAHRAHSGSIEYNVPVRAETDPPGQTIHQEYIIIRKAVGAHSGTRLSETCQ